jgi:hypothetical protein
MIRDRSGSYESDSFGWGRDDDRTSDKGLLIKEW